MCETNAWLQGEEKWKDRERERERDRQRERERETETTDETPNEPGVQDPNSVVRCTGG
jgi:hypothetical protein